MTIQHIVLCGGGPTGFITYGILKQLHLNKFWSLENIKSIYGTSVGGLVGILIALKYKWDWMDDFLIKRPWSNIFGSNQPSILNIFQGKGIIPQTFFELALAPLLEGKGLSKDITLKEFYDKTLTELHLITTDINPKHVRKIDISYKTHPNLKLIKAVGMSSTIPLIFEPVCEDGACYLDGGLLCNYPLNACIESQKCKLDSILAIRNVWKYPVSIVDDNSSFLDLINVLLKRIQYTYDSGDKQLRVPNEVMSLIEGLDSFAKWADVFQEDSIRKTFVERGMHQADIFLQYKESKQMS